MRVSFVIRQREYETGVCPSINTRRNFGLSQSIKIPPAITAAALDNRKHHISHVSFRLWNMQRCVARHGTFEELRYTKQP